MTKQPIEPDEGADALETEEDAKEKEVSTKPERRDDIVDDVITLDTPG